MNISKKLTFEITILIAVAFLISSSFISNFSFNSSDLSADRETHWKIDFSPLIVFGVEDDSRIIGEVYDPEYEFFSILIFIIHTNGTSKAFDTVGDYSKSLNLPVSGAVFSYILSLLTLILIASLFYFFYKGTIQINLKKTNNFLYVGLILLFLFIFEFFAVYTMISSFDFMNLGFTNYIRFEYGFYLGIISCVLFLLAYFLQDYLLDFPKTEQK